MVSFYPLKFHASSAIMRVSSRTHFNTRAFAATSGSYYDKYTQKSYTYEDVAAMREKYHAYLLTYYKQPFLACKGSMQYLYDQNGTEFLDLFGGILSVSVGHSHPKVVEAQSEQIQKLQHTSAIYMNPELALYSKELLSHFPPGYQVHLVNSGSEANEMAILLARLYTRNFDMISLRHAYHGMTGNTMGLLGVDKWKYNVPQGFGMVKAMNPNPYRSLVPADQAVQFYAQEVRNVIESSTPGNCAGFIVEAVQGVNGLVRPPVGYMKAVSDIVHEYGGVFIVDEVQSGFGRLGKHFWGFEYEPIEPDMIVMAKAIANGLPLAGLVAKKEIFDMLRTRNFFNTFGGNVLSCASARAVLRIIEEDNLQAHVDKVGSYAKAALQEMSEKYESMGEVRGDGFLLGVEFVKSKKTREEDAAACTHVIEALKDARILIGRGGVSSNVIRFGPPYCATKENIDYFLNAFETAVKSYSGAA